MTLTGISAIEERIKELSQGEWTSVGYIHPEKCIWTIEGIRFAIREMIEEIDHMIETESGWTTTRQKLLKLAGEKNG